MNINPFIDFITAILGLYSWVLIIWIILSWLIAFNIINKYQPFVSKLSLILYRLTEPVLAKIRKYMPELGGIDISPIVVFLLIKLVIGILNTYFYSYG